MQIELGHLRLGDIFILDGRTYKAGHYIRNTYHYATCTDVETHKVKRMYLDTIVEVKENNK